MIKTYVEEEVINFVYKNREYFKVEFRDNPNKSDCVIATITAPKQNSFSITMNIYQKWFKKMEESEKTTELAFWDELKKVIDKIIVKRI